jgi:hypothetical protein
MDWLGYWGIPVTSLTFSRDKTVVPVDAFIEDRPENFQDLLDAGVDSYLVDRPWNQDFDFDPARRVKSVAEYIDKATSRVLV